MFRVSHAHDQRELHNVLHTALNGSHNSTLGLTKSCARGECEFDMNIYMTTLTLQAALRLSVWNLLLDQLQYKPPTNILTAAKIAWRLLLESCNATGLKMVKFNEWLKFCVLPKCKQSDSDFALPRLTWTARAMPKHEVDKLSNKILIRYSNPWVTSAFGSLYQIERSTTIHRMAK